MFLCPKCNSKMTLPSCSLCGHTIPRLNHIWQFTDAPDMVIDGDNDKYIGYEHIGENYSGSRKYLLEERDVLFAEEVSSLISSGQEAAQLSADPDKIILDLACGDGCFTVPCAKNGARLIAGDISNTMLRLLQEKAAHNHISLENVTLCRMNALAIPLADESVDIVTANSMLHLISNPQKVLCEIYRILKKGGFFICQDDRPGKNLRSDLSHQENGHPPKYNEAQIQADNEKYSQLVNAFYSGYWQKLMPQGILPKKYSWKFDRDQLCSGLFSTREEKLIPRGAPYETTLEDGFLPRIINRGFSDQTHVPKDAHEKAIHELLDEFHENYGEDFGRTMFHGVEDDLLITAYRK